MKKVPVVAVVGPTASGKTRLGVEICKNLNGEVISADSMQVYKTMNIATAKPTADEMQGITHHLINLLEPEEHFSVARYCEIANDCITDISSRGKLPVIVGGTGLYIDALLNNIVFPTYETNNKIREQLKEKALNDGAEVLYDELNKIDPETASKLHLKDTGRIIRALELYYTTGKTASDHNRASKLYPSPYLTLIIGLNFRNRQKLYENINNRIDVMLDKGLIDEAEMLYNTCKSGTSLQAIGYKELFPYFEGIVDLPEAIEKLKQESRRYAKRQITWFRKNENIRWIYIDDFGGQNSIIEAALKLIDNSGVLG